MPEATDGVQPKYPDIPPRLIHSPVYAPGKADRILAAYSGSNRNVFLFCEIDERPWAKEVVRRWNNHTMTTNQLKAIWAMMDAARDPLNRDALKWADEVDRAADVLEEHDAEIAAGNRKLAALVRKLADRDVFMRQKIKELSKE